MLLTASGDEVLIRALTFRWFKRFQEGREDVENKPRSGRPEMTVNPELVDKVSNLLTRDSRLTLRFMAGELNENK